MRCGERFHACEVARYRYFCDANKKSRICGDARRLQKHFYQSIA
jgi:hypothetical protein